MNFKHYNGKRLVIWIVILFIIEGVILTKIHNYTDQISNPWKQIIDISSLVGSLSLVFFILEMYDKYLWSIIPSRLNLVSVPDINGIYEGKIISSYKDETKNPISLNCVMTIHQTASDIFIEMEFLDENKRTSSKSHSEQIENFRGLYFILQFVHMNDGNYDDKNLNSHKGLTTLKYFEKTKEFKGHYFNDPHRGTHGTLDLKKKV